MRTVERMRGQELVRTEPGAAQGRRQPRVALEDRYRSPVGGTFLQTNHFETHFDSPEQMPAVLVMDSIITIKFITSK